VETLGLLGIRPTFPLPSERCEKENSSARLASRERVSLDFKNTLRKGDNGPGVVLWECSGDFQRNISE